MSQHYKEKSWQSVLLHILWGPVVHQSLCRMRITNWQGNMVREWRRNEKASKRLHAHTAFVQKSILQPSCWSSACCSQWEQRGHLLCTSLLSDPQGHQCVSLPSSRLCCSSWSHPGMQWEPGLVRLLLWRWWWNVNCFSAPTPHYV